jgi:hypothetical protein
MCTIEAHLPILHPQLIFIRLRCHLLPTGLTHIDVGIVALRVLAIVPIIGLRLRDGGQINIRRIVKRTIIA